MQPGSDKTLHIVGTVTTPTGGWKVALQKRTPQDINPRILILDLAVTPPTPRSFDKVEIHCCEGDKDKLLANLDVELAR